MIIKAFNYKKKEYLKLNIERSLFVVGEGMLKFTNLKQQQYFSCIVINKEIKIGKTLDNSENFRIVGNFKYNSVLIYDEIDVTKPFLVEFPMEKKFFLDIIICSGTGVLDRPYLNKKYMIYSLLGNKGKMLAPLPVGRFLDTDSDEIKITKEAKQYNWI